MTRTDQDKILLLKGQIRRDIRSIHYSEQVGLYEVIFDNGKIFRYKPENCVTLTRFEDMPAPVRVTRVSDGMVFQNVLGVTSFASPRKVVKAYRVVFDNGDHRDYLAQELLVEKHVKGQKAKNAYNYLKEVSNFSHIAIDDDVTIGLFQKYAKVKMITENSPLASYLDRIHGGERYTFFGKGIDTDHIIFPFGCNRSQYNAVKNALTYKTSIIQGPPGTGKTQTILNIVANLLIAGKSVEIVSNNNSAVANVAEKMRKDKYDLYWLAANLGKSANKTRFYECQIGYYPILSKWERKDLDVLKNRISQLTSKLMSGYENQEKLAVLMEDLRQLKAQNQHIEKARTLRKVKLSSEALDLLTRIETAMREKGKIGIFLRWKLRRKGITDPVEGQKALLCTFYERKIDELAQHISTIAANVDAIAQNEKKLEEYSLEYLHGVLFKMYNPDGRKRQIFNQVEVEKYNPQRFLKEYPVVLSTTFSATTNICQGVPFDYLIMDEASQVDVAAGALAMNAARNAVIVGDEKQLPNVVTIDDEIAADMLLRKYDIPVQYDFSKYSFLSSLHALLPDIPSTILREHYRCSPAIIEFCNRQFYSGALIAMTKEGEKPSLRIWSTGEGNFARGTTNRRQAEMIAKEIMPSILKEYSDIGIIAPYNDQVHMISSELRSAGYNDIPVATVHKFQGRENDVIILSTVDNQIREFVDDPHLLNVAVSRAKKLFVLVVSGNELPDSNIRDLYNYIKYNNGEVFTSSLNSVFDLLYASKTEAQKKYLSRLGNSSRFKSENLMFALLTDILKEERYNKYNFVTGYPLNILIQDCSSLDKAESDFVHRSWSHLDFLIYDMVTHAPILAIEVDGTSFHFKGSDQSKRDRIKDSVLSKVGLPLLRLSTDGSGEKEKIKRALESLQHSPVSQPGSDSRMKL